MDRSPRHESATTQPQTRGYSTGNRCRQVEKSVQMLIHPCEVQMSARFRKSWTMTSSTPSSRTSIRDTTRVFRHRKWSTGPNQVWKVAVASATGAHSQTLKVRGQRGGHLCGWREQRNRLGGGADKAAKFVLLGPLRRAALAISIADDSAPLKTFSKHLDRVFRQTRRPISPQNPQGFHGLGGVGRHGLGRPAPGLQHTPAARLGR